MSHNDVEADILLKLRNHQPLNKKNAFEPKKFKKEFSDSGSRTNRKSIELIKLVMERKETKKTRFSDMFKPIDALIEKEGRDSIKKDIKLEKNQRDIFLIPVRAKTIIDAESELKRSKTILDKIKLGKRTATQAFNEIGNTKILLILKRFFTKQTKLHSSQ